MRTALKLVIALVGLAIVAIAVQSCVAFFRTPSVVAQAWKSGNLQLQLSEFREQRLQWLLKVQDPDFYHHHGVDSGTPGAGYTTVTQGLVKILFYSYSFKPGFLRWRKIQQTVITLAFNGPARAFGAPKTIIIADAATESQPKALP